MSILAQFPCSNGGLRPTARLKKVFKAGKATPTTAQPHRRSDLFFENPIAKKISKETFRDLKTTFAVSFAGTRKIKKKRSILCFFCPFVVYFG